MTRVYVLWEANDNADNRVVAVFASEAEANVVQRFLKAGRPSQDSTMYWVNRSTFIATEDEAADAPF